MVKVVKGEATNFMDKYDDYLQECAERRRNQEGEGDIFLEDRAISGDIYTKNSNEDKFHDDAIIDIDRILSNWKGYK